MMYLRCTFVVLVAVAVISLSACTKKQESSSAAPMSSSNAGPAKTEATTPDNLPHPCTLLTTEDAEAVLGPGAKLVRDSVTDCDLQAKNLMEGGSISVKIEPATDEWAGGKEMNMKFDKNVKSVSGFGDDAYSMSKSLFILKGKTQIAVIGGTYKGKSMSKEEAVEYIAKKVLAKL